MDNLNQMKQAGVDTRRATYDSELIFVDAVQKSDSTIDDAAILERSDYFIEWDQNWTGKAGSIVRDDEKLYRSIHDVGTGQNTKPSQTPSMWTQIGNPAEEYPEWFKPIGAHDAYSKDDKVTHNGKKWISIADANVWEPGVYGWTEVT